MRLVHIHDENNKVTHWGKTARCPRPREFAMSSRPRPMICRPVVEPLESRDAPARLVVLSEPTLTPTGAVAASMQIAPFPLGYGLEWSGQVQVTAPQGSATGTFHPGAFTWEGILEVAVEPEVGETLGTPVSVFVSSGGTIGWDLDPKTASGPSTSQVRLGAGIEGQAPWFDLIGGQSDPDGSTTGSQAQSDSAYVEIATSIGDTIRIGVTSAGQSDSWVLNANTIRGKVSSELGVGFYLPPDLVAGPITWNRDGTVGLQYEVRFRDLDPTTELQNELIWLNDNDAPVSDPIPVVLPQRTRGEHELRVVLGPPPLGARKLAFSVNSDGFVDEQDLGNNWSESVFVHDVAITGATFDGDSRPDVIGRFFSGVSVPGQHYLIRISSDLATFVRDARQIIARLGPNILSVKPAVSGPTWDGLTYRTAVHDPGRLIGDTQLTVHVMAGGRSLAQTSVLIDVEPMPTWIRAQRLWSAQFVAATQSYTFSGPILDLSVASLVNPVRRWVGLPASHRLQVTANLQVAAGLDPTRSDLLTVSGSGRAVGIYHNRLLFEVNGPLNIAPFDLQWNLDPRTLVLSSAQVTLNYSGQSSLSHLFGTEPRSSEMFRLTPTINAVVDYSAAMSVSLWSEGRITPESSTLSFDYRGALSGDLGLVLPLGPTLSHALQRLRGLVGVPSPILHQIQADLTGTRRLPTLQIFSPLAGRLDSARSVRVSGYGRSPRLLPLMQNSLIQFSPNISYSLVWEGGSFVEPAAEQLNRLFALERRA